MKLAAVRTLRIALLLATVAIFRARPAAAQQADTARITTAVWTACPGARVRVAAGDSLLQGRCGGVRDGRLIVTSAGEERAIELVQIDTVWLRRRATGRGAAIGAVGGGVVLGLLGLAAGHGLCEQPNGCGSEPYQIAAVAALTGVLGGTLTGGFIGYNVTAWSRRYPR
ncbi:hypothetical protein [Longimicrobium sp.]|uniref:hypothetical protein n=1 Tax=Longimicrobium sp. TaxID=2029185 RepID=UPI002F9591D9